MKLSELPLNFMATQTSCPRQEALDDLESLGIVRVINSRYTGLEDIADAFDGAFTGFQTNIHLSRGCDKETWLIEALGWYDLYDHKNLDGPFFKTLKTTLEAYDIGDFFNEMKDYIIKHKGKLD